MPPQKPPLVSHTVIQTWDPVPKEALSPRHRQLGGAHKRGYASITDFAEQVVSTVQEEYLNHVGFNVWDDRIKVYYRDLSGTHCQVRLDRDLSNPRWIDLRESASAWFDRVWEWMEQNPRGTGAHR